MANLGHRGRFGNQVFQYAFLRIYADRHGLRLQTPRWIGQYLFGHSEPRITEKPPTTVTQVDLKNAFSSQEPPHVDADFNSQFMSNMKNYEPYKAKFVSLFQPVPPISTIVEAGMEKLRKQGKTVIALHLRRGDFLNARFAKHPRNFPIPNAWYLNWLAELWPRINKPVLYIASDDLKAVLPDFVAYRPVTAADVFPEFPSEPKFVRIDPSIYPDFYVMTQSDALAISNSSFSFAASLLNERCWKFMRPHKSGKLVPYKPWKSDVRLNLR